MTMTAITTMMIFDENDEDGENDEDYGAVFFLPFALHTHAFVSMVQFCFSIVFVHWGPAYNNIIGPFCSLFLFIKDMIYGSINVSCFIMFYGCCGGGVGVVLLVADS